MLQITDTDIDFKSSLSVVDELRGIIPADIDVKTARGERRSKYEIMIDTNVVYLSSDKRSCSVTTV